MRNRSTSGDQADGLAVTTSQSTRTMTRIRWVIVGGLLGFALTAWTGIGRHRDDSLQGGGGSLDGAIRSATQGIQSTTAAVGATWSRARDSVQDLALQNRIVTRLGDDKTLDSGRVEVLIEDESTVVLSGLVPDTTSKAKVVMLTRDTRGVHRVVDQLAVIPDARVIPAAATQVPVPTIAIRDQIER